MNFGIILNNFALAIREDGTYTPFSGDAWIYAAQMTLLGIGMVFSVLAILMLVLTIFKFVFAGASPKEKKAAKKTNTESKADAAEAPDDVIAAVIAAGLQAYQEDEARSNEALVAVITAAVAAYRASEGLEGEGFRVVSFKRVGGRPWNSKK